MEVAPLYTVEGRPVHVDDLLHCPPALFSRAGPVVLAYRPDFGTGEAVMRCPNGAVPTVRISDLSWKPHPETLAMEQMEAAGIKNPSRRDVLIWVTARDGQNLLGKLWMEVRDELRAKAEQPEGGAES